MKPIPTKTHGMIDYGMGVLLIAAPWLLGFSDAENGMAIWVPVVLGVLLIGMSLMTDYELGAAKMIPMPAHLMVDYVHGAVLLVSPWLFGFAGEVWIPHVVLGIAELGVTAMTQKHPSYQQAAHAHGAAAPHRH